MGSKPKIGSLKLKSITGSIWFFPGILTIILVGLTAVKVSGSSIGMYYTYLYGNQKDPALIFNQSRDVRTDEWIVRTPKNISQTNNHYSRINQNIGLGEDESVSLDLPYKDWSALFRPLDWPFLVLPLEYAFAMKWWLMGILLIIGAYFFVLYLLPGKRLIAACIGLALFFSAFVQWWYEYDTFASLFYPLFISLVFMNLIRTKRLKTSWLLSFLLAYLLACFALVLYPPFQIACGLVLATFAIGYLMEAHQRLNHNELLKKIGLGVFSVILASLILLIFIETRSGPVKALEHTVYPGNRITQSGGYSFSNFLSGNLDFQLQFSSKAANYRINGGQTNQSEASNFILLLPFLLLPSFYLMWRCWRTNKKVDWPLAAVNILFVVLLLRLFAPYFNNVFKFLLLDRVPHQRLIIGIGFLSIIQSVLFIRSLRSLKKPLASWPKILIYCLLILALELLIAIHIHNDSPGFIGHYRLLVFSLPVPVIAYLILARKYEWGLAILVVFSILTSAGVNPVYKGMSVLTNTPLSLQIQKLAAHNDGRWVTEGLIWEQFPQMNGAPSLSGVYSYPQLNLWHSIDRGKQGAIYNRYAHAEFVINRSGENETSLKLVGPDHFQVRTNACSGFLRENNVHFLLTTQAVSAPCTNLIQTIPYPATKFYIYHIN
jgi:hypothetical protein